jgi:precorrin-2 methylase
VVFVERVGGARQKVLTSLDEMAVHTPDYLSLMIIRRN